MTLPAAYASFLATKAPKPRVAGMQPGPMPGHLFDYQRHAVDFCLRRGRAALFLDTGLGKTLCELEFAAQAARATNGSALILTPLAVARQIEAEGRRFGYDARVIQTMAEANDGISICNYDRLHHIDPEVFGAVVLDESSVLKNFTGKITARLTEAFSRTRFKLCATATPAPNDHTEIGTHAAFLGVMSRSEMLVRWFVNDSSNTKSWRLKGHAEQSFWDWLAGWAIMAQSPEDLGYDGSRFVLPGLNVVRHPAIGEIRVNTENMSATRVHEVKRQTAEARAAAAAALVTPDEPWVVWCDTDYEADALARYLPAAAEIRGSHPTPRKEATLAAFASGAARTLITKPSVTGQGLNWQFCANMVFVGRSFSYESWYQAVRRCWRFGQSRDVTVHLIVAEGEDQIGAVIDRKAGDHAAMKANMAAAMRRGTAEHAQVKVAYTPHHQGSAPAWLSAA